MGLVHDVILPTGGSIYPANIRYSALCEFGFSSSGAVADNATMALCWKPTVVDIAYPLCDPTHHYLLTIRKVGTTVTVWKQDIQVGSYTTSATTYAGLLAEALTQYAGATAGYVSRLVIVEAALDYTSFYQASGVVTGLWVPRWLAGLVIHTLLDFSDAVNLGADYSGNGNDWDLTGAIQSVDTPTNNYAVINPLRGFEYTTGGTLSDGNLKFRCYPSGINRSIFGTAVVGFPFYFEVGDPNLGILYHTFGIATGAEAGLEHTPVVGGFVGSWGLRVQSSTSLVKYEDGVVGTDVGYPGPFADGDVLGVAVDPSAGKMWVSHNGTWILNGDPATGENPLITFTPQPVAPGVGEYDGGYVSVDFGQHGYAYTQPDGFITLANANMLDDDYSLSGAYDGNGVANGPHIWTGASLESVTIEGTTYTNDGTPGAVVMFTSCGFKLVSTTQNASGTTYNWAGVLLTPAKYSNAQ
jgi:hypothetical protein